jgi:hypothetical protein
LRLILPSWFAKSFAPGATNPGGLFDTGEYFPALTPWAAARAKFAS